MDTCFHPLNWTETLPEQLDYPHYYRPSAVAKAAAQIVQEQLVDTQLWSDHLILGEQEGKGPVGKMFGVLVVKNQTGQLGFLAAFSGKLAGKYEQAGFVPPVYNLQNKDGFFLAGEAALNELNQTIATLENAPALRQAQHQLEELESAKKAALKQLKDQHRIAKKARHTERERLTATTPDEATLTRLNQLEKESIRHHFELKDAKRHWQEQLAIAQTQLNTFSGQLATLKAERKAKSAALQQRIFKSYRFLNVAGEQQDLLDLFAPTYFQIPPAGAGECAAPKLFQYAFANGYLPVALAEFWWGPPPLTEIRRHGQFYPACRGKCEPILQHMLKRLPVAPNLLLTTAANTPDIKICYEDEWLAVINKPAGMLSVPGKAIEDSVWQRVRQRYPAATGPLVVHRLDMSTSGLMLIAKDEKTYKALQQQFIKREIKKRYAALLDGELPTTEGTIDLPLRGDFYDRPRQIVCHEHGKAARTHWRTVQVQAGKTLVHFFPITGRTHQLRVHAAHAMGLATPIIGDDLYGTPSKRLYLHAEWIKFRHPITQQWQETTQTIDF